MDKSIVQYGKKIKGKNIIFSLFISILLISIASCSRANATTVGFDAGRIVDDIVFTNYQSMTVGQIQTFLNSKVSSCDTNGSLPATDFGRSDLTHAQYAASKGWSAPPYTCLKDYYENGLSSAQIIYNVSLYYHINPQVFIVLLQKEQGLVTDNWPLATQYKTATGYGCPDTAACDSQYYGLTAQLNWAGTLFHTVATGSQSWSNPYKSGTSWYSPYTLGNNFVYWSPNLSCGGSTVNILNRSTAALYDYTPYRPNQAALNSGYGAGDSCSAYGNRNFYNYFTDWFGSTTRNLVTTVGNGVYQVENGVKRAFPNEITFLSYSYKWPEVLSISNVEFNQIPDGTVMPYNANYRDGQLVTMDGNSIYLIVDGQKRNITSESVFLSYSWKWSYVRAMSSQEFNYIPDGAAMPYNTTL